MTTAQKELPAGWKWVKLGDVCDFIGGSQPPKSTFKYEWEPGYIRLIQIRDYGSDDNKVFIKESDSKRFCTESDIMIARYGGVDSNKDSSLFRILKGLEGAYNVALVKTVIKTPSSLDTEFLYWSLQQDAIKRAITSKSARAVQSGFRKENLQALPFLLPPLEEQKRIAEILNNAEELKKLREEADRKTEELLPAIFYEMFGDGTGWEFMTLKEVCSEISYGISQKVDKTLGPGDGDRLLTIANVTKRGTIDLDTERYIRVEDNKRDKTLLQKGDILFNWRNGSLDHIGKVAYWDDALGAPAHHVSFLLKLRTKETVADPFYLWAYMDGIHKSGFYARMSRRQVNVKFNSTELGAMKVPVPPLKLQQQFVARLEKAKDLIASQSGGSGKLANLQSSLLQRGFRGEL